MASAIQFEVALKEVIEAEREVAVANLVDGAPENYAEYREAIGFIRALDQFGEWCAEVGKKLDER